MPITLTGLDGPTFLENTVNAAPQIIDGDVAVTGSDFNGAVLRLVGLWARIGCRSRTRAPSPSMPPRARCATTAS